MSLGTMHRFLLMIWGVLCVALCHALLDAQAVAGLLPDGRQVVNRAQEEATSYKS
jgi:hypothetical protein